MRPILIQLGPISVYSYGFFLALAFLISFFLIAHDLKERGLDPSLTYDLIIYAAIGGILGARLLYIATHPGFYLASPLRLLSIQEGLIFYGGLAGGSFAVYWFLKRRGLPILKVADALAPSLALGGAIGRIGCFFNGCCYGKLLSPAFASILPRLLDFRHPTQLYDLAYNLAIFIYLFFFFKTELPTGSRFSLFVLLYSIGRFLVEFFRVSKVVFLGLTGAQLISLVLFLISLNFLLMGQRALKEGKKSGK
ncbi:MAG: prolipoprotein diacylglyceryl transferase [Actinomycetota bacterium]|nr:prolipoprotein diacylglyceryl transferase [Actinomycetota bacterium]